MRKRFVAPVGSVPTPPRVKHTIRTGRGSDQPLPLPNVLLIEVEPDGSSQIYRYTAAGEFGGDTWHESERDAQEQLVFEYGAALGQREPIPDEVSDSHGYVVEWVRKHRKQDGKI